MKVCGHLAAGRCEACGGTTVAEVAGPVYEDDAALTAKAALHGVSAAALIEGTRKAEKNAMWTTP